LPRGTIEKGGQRHKGGRNGKKKCDAHGGGDGTLSKTTVNDEKRSPSGRKSRKPPVTETKRVQEPLPKSSPQGPSRTKRYSSVRGQKKKSESSRTVQKREGRGGRGGGGPS